MICIGDSHIQAENIDELNNIFSEIICYISIGENIVHLGDYYNSNRPTAEELDFGTKWARKFNRISDKNFYLLRGNHTMVNYKDNISSVEYLSYLDIKIVEDVVIDNIYFAHKMTEKSDMFFGIDIPTNIRYDVMLKDLKKYKRVWLGHQHAYQKITDKVLHLGSIRFTTFGEINVPKKYIAKIEKTTKLIELETPIPLKEVYNISELDNINKNTKVRITFKNFDTFKKEIGKVAGYKKKFYSLKIKCDFNNMVEIDKNATYQNKDEIIKTWLESIKDVDVKKELKNEFENIVI